MQTDLTDAQKSGRVGGRKTLAMFGKAHFQKAARARWKKYKLAKKLNGKSKKSK